MYSQAFNVGDVTSYVFQPVVPGQRYCFAVSAYLAGPVHGPNSAEVCGSGDYAPVLIAPGNQSSIIGRPDTLQLQGSDPARLDDKPHIHLDAADGNRRVSDQRVGQERGFSDGRVRCGCIDAVRDQMKKRRV